LTLASAGGARGAAPTAGAPRARGEPSPLERLPADVLADVVRFLGWPHAAPLLLATSSSLRADFAAVLGRALLLDLSPGAAALPEPPDGAPAAAWAEALARAHAINLGIGAPSLSGAWFDNARYWERGVEAPTSPFRAAHALRNVCWLDVSGVWPWGVRGMT
jgi:hypothetical protein